MSSFRRDRVIQASRIVAKCVPVAIASERSRKIRSSLADRFRLLLLDVLKETALEIPARDKRIKRERREAHERQREEDAGAYRDSHAAENIKRFGDLAKLHCFSIFSANPGVYMRVRTSRARGDANEILTPHHCLAACRDARCL